MYYPNESLLIGKF